LRSRHQVQQRKTRVPSVPTKLGLYVYSLKYHIM
jgi:hypothetical protein